MNECIVCASKDVKDIVRNKLPLLECSECHLVWRQEFNVDMSHYEDKEIELGEKKLTARIRNVNDRIKFIKKYIEPNNLCDIGAGEGTFLLELKKKGYKNIVGIEPSKEAISFAKSHDIDVVEGTLSDAPVIIKERKICVVTLFHVIEHLKKPRDVIRLIYDNLPRGGFLVIETPNSQAYSFHKTGFQHPLIYPEHFFYFDSKNLIQLIESVGFFVKGSGKRGFDQYHMSIRESLFYLGVGKSPFVCKEDSKQKDATLSQNINKKGSLIRVVIRKILNLLVLLLRRVDYPWVVAKQ